MVIHDTVKAGDTLSAFTKACRGEANPHNEILDEAVTEQERRIAHAKG